MYMSQKLFCVFLAVPFCKAYTCPLYINIFATKHVFLLYAVWYVAPIAGWPHPVKSITILTPKSD